MIVKKLLVVLLIGVMCLFAGCASAGEGGTIGSVNGIDIYQAEYDYYFENIFMQTYQYYAQFGFALDTEEDAQTVLADSENQAWGYVVDNALIESLATENGITYTDTYLKDVLGYGFYNYIRVNSMYNSLFEKVRQDMEDALVVNEEDVQAAYDADPTKWTGRQTSHILIKVDDVTDADAMAAARQEAADIIALLNNGGDFATLAAEHSDDSSASEGGVIESYINVYGNDIETGSSFDAGYTEGAYALAAVGDFSQEPVESQYGYHIIKLDDIKEGYEAVHDLVEDSLKTVSDEDAQAQLTAMIDEARENADIKQNFTFKWYVDPATVEEDASGTDVDDPEADADTPDDATDDNAADDNANDDPEDVQNPDDEPTDDGTADDTPTDDGTADDGTTDK